LNNPNTCKLHQYPKWGFGEFRTATLIVQRLREAKDDIDRIL